MVGGSLENTCFLAGRSVAGEAESRLPSVAQLAWAQESDRLAENLTRPFIIHSPSCILLWGDPLIVCNVLDLQSR